MRKKCGFLGLLLALLCSLPGCTNQTEPEDAEKWAMLPMVLLDGTLYLDTGYDSTSDGRCGVMDGEIISSVPGSEKPTEEKQSNFGTGYGYQYGTTEGTIEIEMNGKWRIFATEEVRQEMQFPMEKCGEE